MTLKAWNIKAKDKENKKLHQQIIELVLTY